MLRLPDAAVAMAAAVEAAALPAAAASVVRQRAAMSRRLGCD